MWLLLALVVTGSFALGGILGAPFLPTRRRDFDGLFELLDLGPGQKLVDLGSGDGRLLYEAARRGISATGYEINPWLWLFAWVRLRPYRRLAAVRLANFWSADLSQAEAVFVFLIPRYMRRLDHWLQQQHRPLKVVSYGFKLPGRQPAASRQNYWLYRYPNS